MEPEGLLRSSQELFTCTYPEPEKSSPQHSNLSLKVRLNIIYPHTYRSSYCYLSLWLSYLNVTAMKASNITS
jgi:hypothetical protein